MTLREHALEAALRRLLDADQGSANHDWPPYRVAWQNARDLLDGRLDPQTYLNAIFEGKERP